jgi:O-acetyl-ADP-ribose deacetylase (regulator of RNase III)
MAPQAQDDLLLRVGYTDVYVTADIERGNIGTAETEVIVSSEGTDGAMMGGVSHSIRVRGGNSIRESLRAQMPFMPGEVVVTSAGELSPPVKNVFHAIVVGWGEERKVLQATIWRTARRCMTIAQSMGIKSIAFPSLGTGHGEAETFESLNTLAAACLDSLKRDSSIERLHFFFISPNQGKTFTRAFLQQRILRQTSGLGTSDTEERQRYTNNLAKVMPELLDIKADIGHLTTLVQELEKNPSVNIIENYVDTGGGAYIEGDVNTEGGNFIGRDQQTQ